MPHKQAGACLLQQAGRQQSARKAHFNGQGKPNTPAHTACQAGQEGGARAGMIRASAAGRSSPPAISSTGGQRPAKTPGRTRPRRLYPPRRFGEKARMMLRRGGQQLRDALIGELPSSLSLRTKVRIILEARPLGHLWMIYQIVLTLLSCGYVAISSAYHKDAAGLFIEEMVFGASVLVDLLLRFYASDHRRWYFFERQALVDIASIAPVIQDIVHLALLGSLPRVRSDGPIFPRIVHGLKLIRILRVFNVGRQFSSPVVRQTIILVFAVICILYMAASLINMSEGIPFGSAVYFSVVTLATVGYGDITVASALGRFWVCCLICISFIWLPYEINRLTQMLNLRSRYLTSFTPRADKPNVLLVGHLEAAKLSTFLTEFFHPDRRTDVNQAAFYHVVILDNEEPSDELVEVLEAPLIESRVTFIKGTIMDEEALIRAGAKSAVAAFVFSDGLAGDTEAADALTVLRVLVLKTFRPVLPCYVQLHHAHNRVQLHMLKRQRLVCIEDLKMSIMGLSALYPGFTTLLTNLLKSSVDQVADARMPQWQREYIEGSQLEVYMVRLPEVFNGLSFHQVACEAYTQLEGSVLLLGIEERELRLEEDAHVSLSRNAARYAVRRVLINPGRRYRISVQPPFLETWAYVLAGNRHVAEQIQDLDLELEAELETSPRKPFHQAVDVPAAMWRDSHDVSQAAESEATPTDEEEGLAAAPHRDTLLRSQQPIPERHPTNGGARSFSLQSTLSSVSGTGNVSFQEHQHDASTGSLANQEGEAAAAAATAATAGAAAAAAQGGERLDRLTSLSSFHSTRAFPAEEDGGITVVDDVRTLEHVENHIVVLLPKANTKIQYLLRPLRALFLRDTSFCKSIVILTEANVGLLERHCQSLEPATDTTRAWDPIAAVPVDIYVVEGQPHKAGDLRRAGIETAYTCVFLADRASVQEIDEEAVDEYMIHQFVTIEKLRTRLNPQIRPPLNYVVEVLSLATLKILDQTYKTFKGKARRTHRKHRHGTHFGELRGRFSVFRSGSPIRAAAALAAASGQSAQRKQQAATVGAAAAAAPPPPQQSQQQQQQQQPPRPPSLAVNNWGSSVAQPASTDALTPVSDPSGSGGSALLTNGVDFGVSHAAMYPFVTAGASFLIDVFDIITCQLFYNSDLIRFVDLLLALDHAPPPATDGQGAPTADTPTVSASGATTIKVAHWSELRGRGPHAPQQAEHVASGRLGRIPVPPQCVGQTYGQLFELLMAEHEAVPLALYRHDVRADVFYVFTGPPPATVLRPTDCVFLLAPIESLRQILAKYGA